MTGVGIHGSHGRKSYLALSSVPTGGGWTLVDYAPDVKEDVTVRALHVDFPGKDRTAKAPYSFGSTPSPWSISITYKQVANLHKHHWPIESIVFTSPNGPTKTFTYSGPTRQVLALLQGDFAVIQDGRSVILWSLKDDRRYLLASGWGARVWSRDLRKTDRFKPIATSVLGRKKLTYVMKHPRDIFREPK